MFPFLNKKMLQFDAFLEVKIGATLSSNVVCISVNIESMLRVAT